MRRLTRWSTAVSTATATATWVALRQLRSRPWRVVSTLVLLSGPAALGHGSPESVAWLWIVVGVTLAFGTVAAMVDRRAEIEQQRRLGRSRLATIGHLFVEAGMLALVGGIVGATVAWCTTPAARTMAADAVAADLENVPISVAVALAAVVAPAWWASRRRRLFRDLSIGVTDVDTVTDGRGAARLASAIDTGRPAATRGRVRLAVARVLASPARSVPAVAAVATATAMSVVHLAAPGRGPSDAVWRAILVASLALVVEYGWRTASDRRAETVALVRRGVRHTKIVSMFGRESACVGVVGSVIGGVAGLTWVDVDQAAGQPALTIASAGIVVLTVAMLAIALTVAFTVASAAVRGTLETAIGPRRLWTIEFDTTALTFRRKTYAHQSCRRPTSSRGRRVRRLAVRTIAPGESTCRDLVSSDVHCRFNSPS